MSAAIYFCPACSMKHSERTDECAGCGEKMTHGRHARDRTTRKSNLNSLARKRKVTRLRRRDGDRCWICRHPINFSLDPMDEWGWSVDHVIPLAHGGRNADGNLKLAHRFCNRERGAG